jgi:molecular chaperone DnaK (HSP70)
MMADGVEDFEGRVVLGIDLGTTNSAVAVWSSDQDLVVSLPVHGDRVLLPSIVGWDRDRRSFVVGDDAAAIGHEHPTDAACSIKRYLGRSFDDREVTEGQRAGPGRPR